MARIFEAERQHTMATDESGLNKVARGPTRLSVLGLIVIAMGIVASGVLSGRVWWCEAGDLWPWTWDVWSRHCSQHLVDPYSLSHLQHGIGLYLIVTAFGRHHLHRDTRVLLVALVEAAWEV